MERIVSGSNARPERNGLIGKPALTSAMDYTLTNFYLWEL